MKVSVVTISYNRKNELKYLYESLLKQTSNEFNWIVVDDGSEDNTSSFIENKINENKINIEYLKKENGGKHSGINYFLDNAITKKELIFFVDSDDIITKDAIELIIDEYSNIQEVNSYSGLCFLRLNRKTAQPLTKFFPNNRIDSNVFEMIKKYNLYGDKAEVFLLSELLKYRFPIIKNEKFMSELYIWMKLDKKIRCVNKGIYMTEYQADGYTRNFQRILKNNPIGMTLYYKTMIKEPRFGYLFRLRSLYRFIQLKLMSLKK